VSGITFSLVTRPASAAFSEVLCGSHTCSSGFVLIPDGDAVVCTDNACTDAQCCEEIGDFSLFLLHFRRVLLSPAAAGTALFGLPIGLVACIGEGPCGGYACVSELR